MAKSYKIPADMNSGNLDLEIALQNKDGMGIKPLPVKVILFYLAGILLGFYIITHTFIGNGEQWQVALFICSYGLFVFWLAKYDKTRRMQIQLIPVLFQYLPKSMRHVLTRKNCKANEFWGIAGINSIEHSGIGIVSSVRRRFYYLMTTVTLSSTE